MTSQPPSTTPASQQSNFDYWVQQARQKKPGYWSSPEATQQHASYWYDPARIIQANQVLRGMYPGFQSPNYYPSADLQVAQTYLNYKNPNVYASTNFTLPADDPAGDWLNQLQSPPEGMALPWSQQVFNPPTIQPGMPGWYEGMPETPLRPTWATPLVQPKPTPAAVPTGMNPMGLNDEQWNALPVWQKIYGTIFNSPILSGIASSLPAAGWATAATGNPLAGVAAVGTGAIIGGLQEPGVASMFGGLNLLIPGSLQGYERVMGGLNWVMTEVFGLPENILGTGAQGLAALVGPKKYGTFSDFLTYLPEAYAAAHLSLEVSLLSPTINVWPALENVLGGNAPYAPIGSKFSLEPETYGQIIPQQGGFEELTEIRQSFIDGEARKMVESGTPIDQVYMILQQRYGMGGQWADIIGQTILDIGLEKVGSKIKVKVLGDAASKTGIFKYAGWEENPQLARAARLGKGQFIETLQAYQSQLRTVEIPEWQGGRSWVDRWIADVTPQGEARYLAKDYKLTPFDRLRGAGSMVLPGALIGYALGGPLGAAIGLLGGGTVGYRWDYLSKMTPASRAHEVVNNAALMAGVTMDMTTDPVEVYRYVKSMANNPAALAGELRMTMLNTPDAAMFPLALRDAMPALDARYAQWEATSWARDAVSKLAQVLGLTDDPGARAGNIKALTAVQKLFRQLRTAADAEITLRQLIEKVRQVDTPEAHSILDAFEGKGEKLDASRLKQIVDAYAGKDPAPFDPEEFKGMMLADMMDAVQKWTVDQFNVKPDPTVIRFFKAIKAGQSVVVIGMNPTNVVRNALDNYVTMAAQGVFGMDSLQQISEKWKRYGVEPPRLREGVGPGGMEIDTHSIITDATRRDGAIQSFTDWARDRKGGLAKAGIFGGISSNIESVAGARAMTKGMDDAWAALWIPPEMNQATRTILSAIHPGLPDLVTDALRGAKNMAEVDAMVMDGFSRMTVDAGIPRIAENMQRQGFGSLDEASIRRLFNDSGLTDYLNERLKGATTDAHVRQALTDYGQQVESHLTDLTREHIQNIADNAKDTVTAEGIGGVVKVYDEIMLDLAEFTQRHFQSWEDTYARAEGQPKAVRDQMFAAQRATADETWKRKWMQQRAKYDGIAKGLGFKDATSIRIVDTFRSLERNWTEFFIQKNKLLDKFWKGKYDSPDRRTAAWNAVQDESRRLYRDAALAENDIRAALDTEFVGGLVTQFGEGFRQPAETWRGNMMDMYRSRSTLMNGFWEYIKDFSPEERKIAWNKFLGDEGLPEAGFPGYMTHMRNLLQAEVNGAHDLYNRAVHAGAGPTVPTVPPMQVTPTEAMPRTGINVAEELQGVVQQGTLPIEQIAGREPAPPAQPKNVPYVQRGDPNVLRQMATEYGIATTDEAGRPVDQHLVNAVNKYAKTKYTRLGEIDVTEARAALDARKVQQQAQIKLDLDAGVRAEKIALERQAIAAREKAQKDAAIAAYQEPVTDITTTEIPTWRGVKLDDTFYNNTPLSKVADAQARADLAYAVRRMQQDFSDGEPGKRIDVEGETVAISTTYPDWYTGDNYDKWASAGGRDAVASALQFMIDDADGKLPASAKKLVSREYKKKVYRMLKEEMVGNAMDFEARAQADIANWRSNLDAIWKDLQDPQLDDAWLAERMGRLGDIEAGLPEEVRAAFGDQITTMTETIGALLNNVAELRDRGWVSGQGFTMGEGKIEQTWKDSVATYERAKAAAAEWADTVANSGRLLSASDARTTMETGLRDVWGYAPDEVKNVMALWDARAQQWARVTGRTSAEYYSTRMGGMTRGGEGELYQRTNVSTPEEAQKSLVALHNLTAANLAFADDMGGLAVPSIAVTSKDIQFSSYGEVTLIGDRKLIDPKSSSSSRVFDADAFSPTYPDQQWSKVKSSVANKVIEQLRTASKKVGDNQVIDMVWDYMVNHPNKNKALMELDKSFGAQLAFLQKNGIDIDPIYKRLRLHDRWMTEPGMAEWVRKNIDRINEYENLGHLDKVNHPLVAEYQDVLYQTALDTAQRKHPDFEKGDLAELAKEYIKNDRLNAYDLQRDLDTIDNDRAEVDRYATADLIKEKLTGKEKEYQTWAKELLSVFDAPTLTVRGRKVPYTLNNIVEAMTSRGPRAKEETLTFGPGKARAASSREFTSIEQMHAAEANIQPSEAVKANIQNVQQPLLDAFQNAIVERYATKRYDGSIDSWSALDDAYRSMAQYIKGGKKFSEARMQNALSRYGFKGVTPEEAVMGIRAAESLFNTPTEYFEAKIQRGVNLREFVGAVVPDNASPETLEILQRKGLHVETYPLNDDAARQAAVQKFYDKPNVLFQTATPGPIWYSQLQRTIEAIPQETMTAGKLKGLLNNISADELRWTNMEEFLADKQGTDRVTKTDALAAIKPVELVEVRSRGYPFDLNMLDDYEMLMSKVANDTITLSEKTRLDRLVARKNRPPTRYERTDLNIPGGENYREVLITLPVKHEPYVSYVDWQRANNIVSINDDTYAAYIREHPLTSDVTYQSTHWPDTPNVLAHTRLNDRVDVDGKRVLFVEEVQSDWHQEGREKGYQTKLPPGTLPTGWKVEPFARQFGGDAWTVFDEKGNQQGFGYGNKQAAIDETMLHYKPPGIPSAPFSKTWHELVMKRLLREAVDGGYERLEWTTGEQQAARYNLAKQVDYIDWLRLEDGEIHLNAKKDGQSLVVNNYTPNKLAGVIGKEAAQKIIDSPGTNGRLQGPDLTVGGAGMKGFYDVMLPAWADKYAKKWGAKTGETKITTGTVLGGLDEYVTFEVRSEARSRTTGAIDYGVWGVRKDGTSTQIDAFVDKGNATKRAEQYALDVWRGRQQTVHYLDITPAMRESVLQGQSLFQAAKGATSFLQDQRAIFTAFEARDISTIVHETGHLFRNDLYRMVGEITDPARQVEWQGHIRDTEAWLRQEGTRLNDDAANDRLTTALRSAIFVDDAGKAADRITVIDENGRWTRSGEELFARAFEKYMADGMAPTAGLRRVFAEFKKWLLNVYTTIIGSSIDVRLDERIKGTFDRMLADDSAPVIGEDGQLQMLGAEETMPLFTGTAMRAQESAFRPQEIGQQERMFPTGPEMEGPVAGGEVPAEGMFAPTTRPIETLADGTAVVESGAKQLLPGEIQYKIVQDGMAFFKLRKNGTPIEMRMTTRPDGTFSLEYEKKSWSSKQVDQLQAFAKTKQQGEAAGAGPLLQAGTTPTLPVTGQEFTFRYLHNKQKSTNMGARFGQDIEPVGRYLNEISGTQEITGTNLETGNITFRNPLVLDWGEGYQEPGNWKRVLSERYGGKTGKSLSKALRAEGYDGIVTVQDGHTSEIVDIGGVYEGGEQKVLLQRLDFQQSPEFKRWFGDSKVVDEQGKPLVVYHGTSQEFTTFKATKPTDVWKLNGEEVRVIDAWDIGDNGLADPEAYTEMAFHDAQALGGAEKALAFRTKEAEPYKDNLTRLTIRVLKDLERMSNKKITRTTEPRPTGSGAWFTPNINYSYVKNIGVRGAGAKVMPVYLSLKNPIYLSETMIESAGTAWAMKDYIAKGYDGAIYQPYEDWGLGSPQIVAFNPERQVKSQFNRGTFDPENANILMQYATLEGQAFRDYLSVLARQMKNKAESMANKVATARAAIQDEENYANRVAIWRTIKESAPDVASLLHERMLTAATAWHPTEGGQRRVLFQSETGTVMYQNGDGTVSAVPAGDKPLALNNPPGTVDATQTTPPVDNIQAEGWETWIKPLMGELEKYLTSDEAKIAKTKLGDLNPEAQKALKLYLQQAKGGMAEAKLGSMRWAEHSRDAAMHNYQRRYGFDNVLEMGLPYQFWYTRSAIQWAIRALDKPLWLATIVRLRNMQRKTEETPGFPTRLRGKMKIPIPWLPDWMGDGIYVDPLRVLFPAQQLIQPITTALTDQGAQSKRAQYIIQEWISDESVDQSEAAEALRNRSSDLWNRAIVQAKTELNSDSSNPFEFVNTMFGTSLPITWAYYGLTGQGNKVSALPPVRAINAITAAFGMNKGKGLLADDPIRGLLFDQPGMDEFGQFRVDRELANMAADGSITADAAQQGMIARAGPAFEEAQRRVAQQGALKYGLSILSADLFPEGEQEQRLLQQEFSEAIEARDAGDTTAVTKFFDEHPEYAARISMGKPPAERLKSYLIGIVWDRYTSAPSLYKRQIAEQLGTLFSDAFLNKETRSYDSIDTQTLTMWANMLRPGIAEKVGQQAPQDQLALADPAVANQYQAYLAEKKARWPGIDEIQNAYYNSPEYAAGTAQYPPQLDAYNQWKDAYLAQHPDIIPHAIGKENKLYNAPADVQVIVYQYRMLKDQNFPQIDSLLDAYFNLPDSKSKKAFKDQYPQIDAYYDWRREFVTQWPKAIPYIMSEQSILNAVTGSYGGGGSSGGSSGGGGSAPPAGSLDDQVNEQTQLTWRQLREFSPALNTACYSHFIGGEAFEGGAMRELQRIWEGSGSPNNSLNEWLEEAVRKSFVSS